MPDGTGVVHLKDGWYQYTKKSNRNTDELFWGLLLIKHDYPFENRFLKNGFNELFAVPSNVQLSEMKIDGSLPINNLAGNPVFYLYLTDSITDSHVDVKLLLAQLLLFCLLLYSVVYLARSVYGKSGLAKATLFFAVSLFAIRFLMIKWNVPSKFYELILFDPTYYASSIVTPSLGDLFLNAFFLFMLVYFIYRRQRGTEKSRSGLLATILLTSIFALTGLVTWVFKTLVIDSTISFEVYNVLSLDRYSVIGMLAIACVLVVHFFISDIAIRYFVKSKNSIYLGVGVFVTILLGSIVFSFYSTFWHVIIFSALWAVVLCFALIWVYKYKVPSTSRYLFLYLTFYALLTTFLIENLYERKERNQRKFFSEKLENERDYVAEFLFDNIQKAIADDAFIVNYFKGTLLTRKDIVDRLNSLYLTGYFNRYDLSLLTFDEEGNAIRNSDTLSLRAHFEGLKVEAFKSHSLFYSSDTAKNYSYTSLITIRQDTAISGYLLIQLVPKTYFGQTVYPELLVGGNLNSENKQYDYDYAIYQNEKLVAQYGEFPYPYYWSPDYKFNGKDKDAYVEEPEWEHTITRFSNGKKTVVSIPREPVFEPIATFSYLLTFYFTVFAIWIFVHFVIKHNFSLSAILSSFSISFKARINYSMLTMIVLSFLIIGGITINFFSRQYNNFYSDRLQRKEKVIHATLQYFIKQQLKNESGLWDASLSNMLKLEVARLADINAIDINVYSENGSLLMNSQPAIYEQGLLARRMNPRAYFVLNKTKSVQTTEQEKIGSLYYLATYSPLLDNRGDAIAYLGIPYFERARDVNDEVSSFLISLINVYAFLLICAALLAYYISNSITRPLTIIGEKLRILNLNRKNEVIEWHAKDEIGILVGEYNKMISELEQSAQKLAKSERESAWREMAKQIAHEIKNPLTPMKLSIQYLQRSIDDGKPNIEELAKKVAKTLEEQIENLSSIATAFASFAKMPKAENEIVDLKLLIKGIVDLFNGENGVSIKYACKLESANVFADRNQLISVFNNLIKNAVQSIPENKAGFVDVNLMEEDGWFLVSITDNGVGIATENADRVFVPNFTTKSSGTGLGLAITKQMIDGAGGTIWFESKLGEGTTFFVRLKQLAVNN
jgi:two-component system nitrogen regulation sensor histidine kinase NtrY